MSTSLVTIAGLLEELRRTGLLNADQLNELKRLVQGRFRDARELAKYLAQRRWLTIYQIGPLLHARGNDLIVGPYRILDSLGAGGTAHVFKARDSRNDHIVALKVIHSDLATDRAVVARFQREMEVVRRLAHPHIVRAFDAGTVGTPLYLAMELVHGTNLHKMMQLTGRLSVADACHFVRQAALGLQHAHERELVHRDIKPGNLFITETEGNLKVGDFGLARLQKSGTDNFSHTVTFEGSLVGTADYISPEQARNAREVDIRADIYSLGCTFYHLLAGHPPFPKLNVLTKLYMHAEKEPPPIESLVSGLSPKIAGIICKMMAKKAENRYQTPAEVAAALHPHCQRMTPEAAGK